jgi:hypothetical protein
MVYYLFVKGLKNIDSFLNDISLSFYALLLLVYNKFIFYFFSTIFYNSKFFIYVELLVWFIKLSCKIYVCS